jgi:cell fate (sporulation/competence/biofilm development) regulator YlbF (YheA/YmcA/DUF963 family)
MELNFKWTCPEIDKKIKEIYCEFDDSKENVIKIFDTLYESVKDKIEELRELNSKMRDAADSQIDILYKENQELTRHIKELEEKIEKYE